MDFRRFWAGGSVVAAPAATRTLVFSRALSMPGYDVELSGLALGSQQQQGDMLIEIIRDGQTVLSETLEVGFASAVYSLPFLRFVAIGRLDLFVTTPPGVATTVSAHCEGYYRPEAARL